MHDCLPSKNITGSQPLINDPLRRKHNRNKLFTKDTLQGSFSHIVMNF